MRGISAIEICTLPLELLVHILHFLDAPQICIVIQVNKVLSQVASNDKVWQSIFLECAMGLYTKADSESYKDAALSINSKRGRMSNIFARMWALGNRHNFNPGASVEEIEKYESEMGVKLPTYLREYFLIADGQPVVPYRKGFIHGSRLLPLNEMSAKFKLMKESGGYLEIRDDTKIIGLPLTAADGFQQVVAHELNGQIYLESGWNVFLKANNWHEYLFNYVADSVNNFSFMLM